jgi:hypothetical protein
MKEFVLKMCFKMYLGTTLADRNGIDDEKIILSVLSI